MTKLLDLFFGGKKPSQLDRIESSIARINWRLDMSEAALDQALAKQGEKLDALVTAVNALIAAIPPEADLADEIATVQAQLGEVQTITETVQGATPPSA